MFNKIINRPDERGQVLLIVASGILLFISLVGLVIDTGVGFRERRDLQNASDLAAMAGTKVIADHYLDGGRTGTQVYAAIGEPGRQRVCGCRWLRLDGRVRAADPGATGSEIPLGAVKRGRLPAGAQGVRVDAESTPATFFMRVVGIDEIAVAADATAMTSSLLNEVPAGVLLPIAAFDSDYQADVEYELTAGEEGPGNFGWLTWRGSPNAPTLEHSLCHPDNDAMTFPVWVQGDTGVTNSSGVRDCMTSWLGSTVLIPIWGQTNNAGGSNLNYEVITLGAFVLTDFDQHANKVKGHFVEFYALPGVPAGYGSTALPADRPKLLDAGELLGLTR